MEREWALRLIWVLSVALAGYRLGYTKPSERFRLFWVLVIPTVAAALALDLLPFRKQLVNQLIAYAILWPTSLFWLAVFIKAGQDAREGRVPPDTAFMRRL